MAANTLLLTLLSGVALLGILVVILRVGRWRRGPTGSTERKSLETVVSDAFRSPATWSAGFLALVLIALAGSLALVGALPVPESIRPLVGTVLLIVVAAVFVGFVFAGVYTAVRNRGYGSAPAAGLGSLAVGLVTLVVVVVQLFLGV